MKRCGGCQGEMRYSHIKGCWCCVVCGSEEAFVPEKQEYKGEIR